jgi:hypothetical protein
MKLVPLCTTPNIEATAFDNYKHNRLPVTFTW